MTYKYALPASKINILIATMLALAISLMYTVPVSAASKVYALSCITKGSSVQITKNGKVSCSKKNDKVTVQGIGSKTEAAGDGEAYPDEVALTLVVLDCGNNKPVDPAMRGVQITELKCNKGAPKELRKQNVKPNPIPAKAKPTVSKYNTDGSGGEDLDEKGKVDYCGNNDCADSAADPNTECNAENGCDLVAKYINPAIKLFSYVFGLIAVMSIIAGGIQYAASAGDPQKVAAAKKRIINTVIAIVAYFFLYSFINFLVPGGLF
jgi:Type IV secretion system pilin